MKDVVNQTIGNCRSCGRWSNLGSFPLFEESFGNANPNDLIPYITIYVCSDCNMKLCGRADERKAIYNSEKSTVKFGLIKNEAPETPVLKCLHCGHPKHSEICTVRVRTEKSFTLKPCGCGGSKGEENQKAAA